MVKRNPHFEQLKTNYLFPEINLRKQQFLLKNPNAHLISLGIGDTTEPIPNYITEALSKESQLLGTKQGYKGYGPEQGLKSLREKIAEKIYFNKIKAQDIFISDGVKCDLGRIQTLFGNEVSIAVQDPSYPVYIDGSLILGVKKIFYMPCEPENNFFPNLNIIPRTDLIYFCSPNNPTGSVATKKQLQELVAFAKENRSLIIYDSAYANYIQDAALPRSIFEIEGADEVAIELNSFSKIVGFTGVRLGWSIVPENLVYDDGKSVRNDWNRLMSTIFNGASIIAQAGGYAALQEEGLKEIKELTSFYLENTLILRRTMEKINDHVYGGENAPYLWIKYPHKQSWDVFQNFLENYHLIITPGSGFGPTGESFIRLAAFGHRESIITAAERIKNQSYV